MSEDSESETQRVLSMLRADGPLSHSEIMNNAGLSEQTTTDTLHDLWVEGEVSLYPDRRFEAGDSDV